MNSLRCFNRVKHFKNIIENNLNWFAAVKQHSTNASAPAVEGVQSLKKNIESYGQPTYWTHPHILKEGELVSGLKTSEFISRRQRLMTSIQQVTSKINQNLKNHLVLIPSSTKKYMSDKIPYVFRQNTDFLYLSGCLEPDSVLALSVDDRSTIRSYLFVRAKDKNSELWDGPRTGVENAVDLFAVDEAYVVSELKNFLTRYVNGHKQFTIWYDKKQSDQKDVTDILQETLSLTQVKQPENPTMFIHKLRVIKSASEIDLMRQTCRIASESINETMKETRCGDSEHHIFARVDYKCRMRNASFLAYPPVVAGGKNATTIHYINNTQVVKNGDLVLMDAGCEYGSYTSDITRTWPVSGHFTPIQRTLYDLLLALQKELIDNVLRQGGYTLDELFDTMCSRLGKYLQEIGLISKKLSGLELAKAAYGFCPHHVSHYLGMDVHDTPLISRSTRLLPGMVCTVEPGIYIAADRLDVPEEFRGIGMRIEDDILIKTDNSVEVLTHSCLKDTRRIENMFES